MNNKPTWQLAEQICEVPSVDEAIRTFVDDNTGDNAIGMVLAVLEHQAATEAAKATGTAGELPPLPEAIAGGPLDGLYTANQMREYARSCEKGALARGAAAMVKDFAAREPMSRDHADCQSCVNGKCTTGDYCVTLGLDDDPLYWKQRALKAEAARQPAPVPGLPFADLATPIKEFEARKAAALASPADALVAGDSETAKDAERYRYIRDTATLDNAVWEALEGYGMTNGAGELLEDEYRAGMDRAIDRAIQAQKDGHG